VLDLLASAPHYADHLAAVFGALPAEARGSFMSTAPAVAERIRALGYEPSAPLASDRPVLTAAYGDMMRAHRLGRRSIALMEHGAGQSYGGRGVQHGSYAGGLNRGAASLFLHPGEHPAARDRKAYPRARVEVVGSPHLDTLPRREGPPGRVVAFTFHFNGPVCPETRTAYPHFFPAIAALSGRYEMLGHGHPMLWGMGRVGGLAVRYRAAGIEPVKDFTEVCRRADVLVFDNTSVGFAFAATGRPVVVMNSPRYDRRVNHGLRFWEAAGVGVNCDDPADLAACIDRALEQRPEDVAAREAALDLVYAYRTGAAQRAADVLLDWGMA
jgi:hypothetical protein